MSFDEEFNEYYQENLGHGKFRRFNETTLNGNKITGHICLEQNRYFGSLVINSVNGYETFQLVHGFPKMHYHEYEDTLGEYYIAEKIDGTNIVLYPLLDHNGVFLEAVPKTRRTAVLGEYGDKHFRRLYSNLKGRVQLEEHVKITGATLAFELYGSLNQHTVKYDEDLDYCILARWNCNNIATSFDECDWFKRPPRLLQFSDVGALNGCQARGILKSITDDYNRINNESDEIIHEGVVLTFIKDNEWKFYKAKPKGVYMACVCANGIPKTAIKHSVWKYFDEHSSTAKDDWENRYEKVMRSIKWDLMTDFNQKYVDNHKTVKKIKEVFESILAEREYDETLVEIAEKLVADNPDTEIKDLMRLFSVEYPYLKKDSKEVYNIIKELKDGI